MRLHLRDEDVLVYKGQEIDQAVLDAITSPDKRILWAFVRGGDDGTVMAVPYTEDRVIWLASEDVVTPDEVEL